LTSIPQTIQDDYENKTYEEISKEFQALFPNAMRAFQLVPLMYNRLTLVDNLSHNNAIKKIHDDHIHLEGFSPRSIRRYLPANNPLVPRRVRPRWPKKSKTHTDKVEKLSNFEQDEENIESADQSNTSSRFLNKSEARVIETENLDIHDIQRIKDEKEELAKRVTILQDVHTQDKAKIKDLNNRIPNVSSVTAEEVVSAMNTSVDNVDFEFSLYIEEIQQHLSLMASDGEQPDRLWINGSVNKVTGKIIEIKLGRMEQNSF
jgi:predicted ATP-dependent endonuclease of OLD family